MLRYRGWLIKDTPCFPCRWKVWDPNYATDNATWRYHETVKAAQACIDKHVDAKQQFTGDAVSAPSPRSGGGHLRQAQCIEAYPKRKSDFLPGRGVISGWDGVFPLWLFLLEAAYVVSQAPRPFYVPVGGLI